MRLETVLLQEITEGKIKGKAYGERKRLHMLTDLASSAKYKEIGPRAAVTKLPLPYFVKSESVIFT